MEQGEKVETEKVFVYGTLKHNFGNHHLLEGSEFLGTFKTDPTYTMVSLGGFPGVLKDGQTSIKGEIYEVDKGTFQRLDGLEGCYNNNSKQSMYVREQIDTPHGKAWVYLWNRGTERLPVIESGVWGDR